LGVRSMVCPPLENPHLMARVGLATKFEADAFSSLPCASWG